MAHRASSRRRSPRCGRTCQRRGPGERGGHHAAVRRQPRSQAGARRRDGAGFGEYRAPPCIDFTFYSKKIRDAILLKSSPPSLASGQQFVNIGATSNRGVELALNLQALQRRKPRSGSQHHDRTAHDRVDDLGALPESFTPSINSLQRSAWDSRSPAFYSKKFVSGRSARPASSRRRSATMARDGTSRARLLLALHRDRDAQDDGYHVGDVDAVAQHPPLRSRRLKLGHYTYDADYSNRLQDDSRVREMCAGRNSGRVSPSRRRTSRRRIPRTSSSRRPASRSSARSRPRTLLERARGAG